MIVTILMNGKRRNGKRRNGKRRNGSRNGGEEEEGGKIEVWRKGSRNGERDRERPGKGGEERKSRRECKSESDIRGNYTILMARSPKKRTYMHTCPCMGKGWHTTILYSI